MNIILKQETKEVPTEVNLEETVKAIDLENSIDLNMSRITLLGKKDVLAKHPSCDHTGGCGSRNHRGNGWCWYCSICNPSNPKAY